MTPQSITIKPASLGSISAATLRTEDLLPTFLSELEWQVNRNGNYFSLPENFAQRDNLNSLIGEAQDCFSPDGSEIDPDKEDIAQELVNEALPDALGTFAPPYCYFGAHPGDGADIGYWPSHDEIDELEHYENPDRDQSADYKTVNDHGNVTVYAADGTVLLGLV